MSTGYQRNNLNAQNASESKRWIGNASLSAQLIKGMSLNLNYSNMSSFSRRNPLADPFYTPLGDTLNYYQTSVNLSTSLSYAFGQKVKQSMSATASYSQSQNITGRLEYLLPLDSMYWEWWGSSRCLYRNVCPTFSSCRESCTWSMVNVTIRMFGSTNFIGPPEPHLQEWQKIID